MICNKCGRSLKDRVSLCPSCGASFRIEEIPKVKRSWKIPAIIGGASLVIVISVVALVSALRGNKSIPAVQINNQDSAIVISVADNISNKLTESEKIFTAFENTIGASSFNLSRTYYDWDYAIGQDMGISEAYTGYFMNAEKYISDKRVFFKMW